MKFKMFLRELLILTLRFLLPPKWWRKNEPNVIVQHPPWVMTTYQPGKMYVAPFPPDRPAGFVSLYAQFKYKQLVDSWIDTSTGQVWLWPAEGFKWVKAECKVAATKVKVISDEPKRNAWPEELTREWVDGLPPLSNEKD